MAVIPTFAEGFCEIGEGPLRQVCGVFVREPEASTKADEDGSVASVELGPCVGVLRIADLGEQERGGEWEGAHGRVADGVVLTPQYTDKARLLCGQEKKWSVLTRKLWFWSPESRKKWAGERREVTKTAGPGARFGIRGCKARRVTRISHGAG